MKSTTFSLCSSKSYYWTIPKWKTQAVREIAQLFEDGRKKKQAPDVDIEALYAQLGKLQSQLVFLKKNRHGHLLRSAC